MLAYNRGPVDVTHVSVHMHSPQPCFPAILNWFIQPMHLPILKAISHPGIQLWTSIWIFHLLVCTALRNASLQHWISPSDPCICHLTHFHYHCFHIITLRMMSVQPKRQLTVHPCNHRSILASHAFSESCNCPSRLLYNNGSSLATNPSLHTVTTSHQLMNIHSSR